MYQYLQADEYYLDNNKSYTPITYGNVQFLVNLEDCEAPIFQAKLLLNPFASLVGNYCVTESNIMVISKIDPLFACLKVLAPVEKFTEFESLFNRENQLEFYLSTHKYVVKNIDSIYQTKLIDGGIFSYYQELYVKFDKSKLFEFLDKKLEAVTNYIKNDPEKTFQSSSINLKHIEAQYPENCQLFQEYLNPDFFKEYYAIKMKEWGSFPTQFASQEKQDCFEVDKSETKKQLKQEKKPTAQETKLLKIAGNCQKMDSFFGKKQ